MTEGRTLGAMMTRHRIKEMRGELSDLRHRVAYLETHSAVLERRIDVMARGVASAIAPLIQRISQLEKREPLT